MGGGKTGASRGGKWRSHSGETRDGFAAWTPTLRTAPEISPRGEIPPAFKVGDSRTEKPKKVSPSYLQVKDVILRVQVDAHRLLLDGHD